MTEIVQYFSQLPFWEWLAVICALLYVLLAARENIWCWPAALVSTLIYTVIFYDVYLWMDSLLQLYYLVMAVYGWYCWQGLTQLDHQAVHIQRWPLHRHSKIIAALSVLSLIFGWLMANFTPTDFPYLDSATTVFAVFATYLVAQKVLENWLYWVVIDAVSIYLYLAKDLQPTALLFVLYVVMAIYGYLQWSARYQQGFAGDDAVALK
ncbi:nicotinamide mononucleotide transporter [Thalassotalea insulae]|uniref:Nicotinamide riboside transporter PnuC n=1 Tax=Thalassotalea insulae TaxID=2056778 RepID=A0ABQ6GS83_9GAMM|nr:nicotinamide riboside transporter PnuC [Thalassotalea insulae]GLX78777.1 nicotinamide mononucleotide transporter [Thalassotalea insulae]